MKEIKVKIMKKIEHYEAMILELEQWKKGDKLTDSTYNKVGEIGDELQRDKIIKLLKEYIATTRIAIPDNNKIYLSEIVKREKIKFANNSLILAPVGSGKTTFIKSLIKENNKEKLMLVSNTTLKNSIAPDDDEIKKIKSDKLYTTQNKKVYGELDYKMHVMSYAEFGNRIRSNNDFAEKFDQIFCDEIHSLPGYQQYRDPASLALASKYIFDLHEGKEIYYFTATKENLEALKKKDPSALRNVTTYNFLDHPDIKQYMALSEYKINGVEQIRPHLKARIKSFNYFGYKCLAFNKTISGQKRIAQIAKEEGFNPLVLWSVNNESDPMDAEQLSARSKLLKDGKIPAPYNFLIINSAMQEGWNLEDKMVKLAIMNTINETEKVQSLGRLRHDIDILVYRVTKNEDIDRYVNIPNRFFNVNLTAEDKNELSLILDLKNSNGRLLKWPSIKGLLEKQGYTINDSFQTIDGKRMRASKITITL